MANADRAVGCSPRSSHIYNIARWGDAYFGVNDAGNMTVKAGLQEQGPGA